MNVTAATDVGDAMLLRNSGNIVVVVEAAATADNTASDCDGTSDEMDGDEAAGSSATLSNDLMSNESVWTTIAEVVLAVEVIDWPATASELEMPEWWR